jgi:SOS response regulatory protein OraA/RecX
MGSPRQQAPFDRAVRLLAARLQRAGATADEIAGAVERLARAGYLDDRALAQTQAEALLREGRMAPRAAVQKLTARGIDPQFAEQAVTSLALDERFLARAALEKRYGCTPITASQLPRAARFLASRGFDEAVIAQLVGSEHRTPED